MQVYFAIFVSMEITGKITGIKYEKHLASSRRLKTIGLSDLNINTAPSAFLLRQGSNTVAISKWVSPKRTRSYPYERVYNTLTISKKITVIPIVKDEGKSGDRDFLQWDTVSLMSLLDVYVILAYYDQAKLRVTKTKKRKIGSQCFNNDYVMEQIKLINNYHSSALHWNLEQIKGLPKVTNKAIAAYQQISNSTGVQMHNESGLNNFLQRIEKSLDAFMENSRLKAGQAQQREFVTIQPKEELGVFPKAKITITNYLKGMYYFTVDEVEVWSHSLRLIEAKHTKTGILPSWNDIKDGLLKMILYTNLVEVQVNDRQYQVVPTIKLTSNKIQFDLSSTHDENLFKTWCSKHQLKPLAIKKLEKLFAEARANNFVVAIQKLVK